MRIDTSRLATMALDNNARLEVRLVGGKMRCEIVTADGRTEIHLGEAAVLHAIASSSVEN